GKLRAERLQVDRILDVIERAKSGMSDLADARSQLIHGAAHQIVGQHQEALVAQDRSMPGDDRVDVQGRQAVQRLYPFGRITVECVRDRMDEQITRSDDFLLRQVNYRVARGVAAAEVQNLHFAISQIDVQPIAKRQRRTLINQRTEIRFALL